MSISVYYNNAILSPTPLVSQDYKFVDYNGYRNGTVLEITLNGTITGVTSTGNISQITNIFASQFGEFKIYQDPSLLIYDWKNVIIDDITFPNSHFWSGTSVPYTIKARSYNMPSGVTEPSNEYSFIQNEDGTVNVNHKISARGIKGTNGALSNAISFVQLFTGKNPFTNCPTIFIPSGSGILLSLNEKIDRLNGSYSVTEQYKYSTGVFAPYTKITSLTTNDAIEQPYQTLDYVVKFKGSPVQNNLSVLSSSVTGFDEMADISGNYGIDTSLIIQTSSEITRNSGAAEIEFKISFYSGYSIQDLSGFFDYNVNFKKDVLMPKETWKIDGNFVCRGPLSYKLQQLNLFKSTYASDWRGYFVGLITTSPIYSGFHNTGNLLSTNPVLNIQENTGMAEFAATLTIADGGEPTWLNNPKYSVDIQPSRWAFEVLPSANIEGHYVVQDLQMRTQSRINLSVSAESQFAAANLSGLSGQLNSLANIYVNTGFLIESKYQTGINDLSCSNSWIGQDNSSTGIVNIKVVGSNNFTFNRQSGYYFGY